MHTTNNATPTTTTTTPIAFQQLAEATQEVLRLKTKKQEVGLTPEESNLFDLNRVLLQLHLRQLDVRLVRKRSHSSSSSSPGSSSPSSPASSDLFQGVTTGYQKRVKRVFAGRVCGRCGTAYTSQWRSGPHGPSTLCNACGIRHFRQLKRDARRGKCAAVAASSDDETLIDTRSPAESARRGSIQFVLN
ncbi:GATA zinc finger domain containing protein [Acanthamoeba castellanii str. Neff]|uniref:GATA zinc finger domain containing protein n=1 Tax=Acanthamoeba castellanii (strain ATCC 30010 / Neff) TaxID=1257118 RepID=L8GIT4_ACACF|nr:GATA zinc finger domain containing protein [Acanthamoeba castellanii str. Neff]ELR12990.1 GATA zinc finger domain containing protein [Acanthamoeba castellanii str. Neff]